jgi:hypothetical protein
LPEDVFVTFEDGPVFVYSGFRASSTWLWSKFRAHDNLLCYYEPFNEQLGNLTLENIGEARADNWRSHHPSGPPYALEYAGLLGDGAGVAGFPRSKDLGERYISAAGLDGALDDDVAAYVAGLIGHARDRGRIPLLACTRLLGRTHGLREAFGGYHILLVRNLFHQWNSYAGQARFGNWYFLHTLYETLKLADRDPVIKRLVSYFPSNTSHAFETWISKENFDNIFCYFIGFHLYFLTISRKSVDLVIDINTIFQNKSTYGEKIVSDVEHNIGVKLDLSDAIERVDFPLYTISDYKSCTILIDEIAATIKSLCRADMEDQLFINSLVSTLWEERDIFHRQAAGAIEYVAALEGKLEDTRRQAAQQAEAEREALLIQFTAERQSFTRALDALRQETAEWQGNATSDESEEWTQRWTTLLEKKERKDQELVETSNALALTEAALDNSREKMARMTEELRTTIVHAKANGLKLQERADLLERSLANVDTANIDLLNRLNQANRGREQLEAQLADEKAERQRLADEWGNFLGSEARERLEAMLNTLAEQPWQWGLLPKPLRRRKLCEHLTRIPDFEGALNRAKTNGVEDPLVEAIWTTLARSP